MIGLVHLPPGVAFENLCPEAYTYETLGGNNSRTALAELLEENADSRMTHDIAGAWLVSNAI